MASIILEYATGKQNQDIVATLDCSTPWVSEWRRRFSDPRTYRT
nr:helix-turn-helix domain-containing protein [Methylicorpusculum oleiharenae]